MWFRWAYKQIDYQRQSINEFTKIVPSIEDILFIYCPKTLFVVNDLEKIKVYLSE